MGALSEPASPEGLKDAISGKNVNVTQQKNRDSPKRTSSEGQLGGIREKVVMGPPETTPKGFHRSSTLPSYGTGIGERVGSNASMNSAPSDEKLSGSAGGGPSGLTVFSSNLKNPFG